MGFPLGLLEEMHWTVREQEKQTKRAERIARMKRR